MLDAKDFGDDFLWGIAVAATQIEGAANSYGKGLSIWDTFSKRNGKIKKGQNPEVACDFYHNYQSDIALVKTLGFKIFRFSISWSRILPYGKGVVNQEGISFYHHVIDECLKQGLIPYITLTIGIYPKNCQKLEDGNLTVSTQILIILYRFAPKLTAIK